MKVFVLSRLKYMEGNYEISEILGVFDSYEKAHEEKTSLGLHSEIEEFTLNRSYE